MVAELPLSVLAVTVTVPPAMLWIAPPSVAELLLSTAPQKSLTG